MQCDVEVVRRRGNGRDIILDSWVIPRRRINGIVLVDDGVDVKHELGESVAALLL